MCQGHSAFRFVPSLGKPKVKGKTMQEIVSADIATVTRVVEAMCGPRKPAVGQVWKYRYSAVEHLLLENQGEAATPGCAYWFAMTMTGEYAGTVHERFWFAAEDYEFVRMAVAADYVAFARQLNERFKRVAQERNVANVKLDEFRSRVRDMAIRLHKEGQWCRDGLNKHLALLELDEYTPEYDVTLTVRVRVTGADDESTARSWARNAISSGDSDVEITDSSVDDCEESED